MRAEAKIPSFFFEPILGSLRASGVDTGPLVDALGLDPGGARMMALVPAHLARGMWEQAAALSKDPYFGLHASARVRADSLDVLGYVATFSRTVHDALRRTARYVGLTGGLLRYDVHVDAAKVEVVCESDIPVTMRSPQATEFNLGILYHFLRRTAGESFRLRRARVTHLRADGSGVLSRAFGCDVELGGSRASLELAPAMLELPLTTHEPKLLAIVEEAAERLLASLAQSEDIVTLVRREIARRIDGGDTRLGSVAAALGTSGRTLQRRLVAEGTSYARVLDAARFEAARALLDRRDLSIENVAYLLGFSDSASLHRAYKRWCGKTPRQG